jgi:hypothetical protein
VLSGSEVVDGFDVPTVETWLGTCIGRGTSIRLDATQDLVRVVGLAYGGS